MTEEKSPGLLLQVVPYLGQQKILKILTPGSGLISLFSRRVKNSALLSPFCMAEWVYKKGMKEIYSLTDGSLIDGLLSLRTNYATLSAAGQIAQDLLQTQMPGKHSPELFALVCAIFQKIALFNHPEILVALFRLKLLSHEGLLSLGPTCSSCPSPPLHLYQGESYCLKHALHPGWTFDPGEWTHLQQLTEERSFAKLQETPPQKELYTKIHALFHERAR